MLIPLHLTASHLLEILFDYIQQVCLLVRTAKIFSASPGFEGSYGKLNSIASLANFQSVETSTSITLFNLPSTKLFFITVSFGMSISVVVPFSDFTRFGILP